jgi:hypothetical protein
VRLRLLKKINVRWRSCSGTQFASLMVKFKASRSPAAPHKRQMIGVILSCSLPRLTKNVHFMEKQSDHSTSSSISVCSVAEVTKNGTESGTYECNFPSSAYALRKLPPHCEIQCASSMTIVETFFMKSASRNSLENCGCSRHISGDVNMTQCLPSLSSCLDLVEIFG